MLRFSYFIASFAISFFITAFFARRHKKTQKKYFFRFGGVGIILAFIFSVVLSEELVITRQVAVILAGGFLIMAFGIWDDFKNLSWKTQLMFQIFLALSLILAGYRIDYMTSPFGGGVIRFDFWAIGDFSIPGALVIIIWVLAIINSVNWADGIDGLLGGIGVLAAVGILFISFRPEVNQPAMAIISLIFIGAILGFWIFNLPPSKIIAGTSGSYFLGFAIAAMAIMAGTKIATALIVLAVPLLDAVAVIIERARLRKPLTQSERERHLHFRLMNLGWSNLKILSVYLGFLFAMLVSSLILPSRSYKIGLLFAEVVLIAGSLYYIGRANNKIKRHEPKN